MAKKKTEEVTEEVLVEGGAPPKAHDEAKCHEALVCIRKCLVDHRQNVVHGGTVSIAQLTELIEKADAALATE